MDCFESPVAVCQFYSHSKADQPTDPRLQIDQTIFSNLHQPQFKTLPGSLSIPQRADAVEAIQLCIRATVGEEDPAARDEGMASDFLTKTTEQMFQGWKIADKALRGAFLTYDMSGITAAWLGQGTKPMPEKFLLHLAKRQAIGSPAEKTPEIIKKTIESFALHCEGKDVYASRVETVNRFGDPEVRHWFPLYCSAEKWAERDSILVMACALWIKFVISPLYEDDVQSAVQFISGTGPVLFVEHVGQDRIWGDGGDGTGFNMLGKLITAVLYEGHIRKACFSQFFATLRSDLDADGPWKRLLYTPNRALMERVQGQ
eukprot:TRINITY_DN82365_c0_g1_i1.p1 TRINITY_DN82365_c0_g1~~TRINITY_DN82365_c0_g1_i1.p1  ORF type:complete len:330 (+),score=40.01 TRINITY_DN82365_c0_g1_i1:43-990(+)